MRKKPKHPSNLHEAALRSLRNFCTSLKQSDELHCLSLTALISGEFSKMSPESREQILDYFEALEDLLPALYELDQSLNNTGNQAGVEDAYKSGASSNHLYASCKRHPE